MPLVVFLRGVNVGGHKSFQPTIFAKAMADLDAVSIGAAGTFVVRAPIAEASLRAKFQQRLPFDAELMICRERELIDLCTRPFSSIDKDVKRYVSILAKRPETLPKLPISEPAGAEWQVKITATFGKFVLSLHRRMGRRLIYPNEVVERYFGARATTRNWNTIEAIHRALK